MRGRILLGEMFEDGEADRSTSISAPLPEPGMKSEGRRHKGFGMEGEKRFPVLRQDGKIHFKTDNRELFDYPVHKMTENGFVPLSYRKTFMKTG
jgi:hypothetical protein